VVSPFAKTNFVDHTVTDQTSILRFIEDNWNLGRIGKGSFDTLAGTLQNMFDFGRHREDFERREEANRRLCLDPSTGEPTGCY
jgi:phospholipase C